MKNYTIELEVIGPLHIGSGNTISKKDYDTNRGKVNIYDPLKLYMALGREYEIFLKDNSSLTSFYRKNNLNRKKAEPAIKYTLEYENNEFEGREGIAEFMRDPYGKPYIPGSALKGLLRTVILASEIQEDTTGKYQEFAKRPIKDRARGIEETAFYKGGDPSKQKKNAADDIFRYLRISDSEPLDNQDIILARKVDLFTDDTVNELNIFRESLRPNTKVRFRMTIDNPRGKTYFTKEGIEKAILDFAQQYYQAFSSKFPSEVVPKRTGNIIYFGGGVGFVSKTIDYPLYGKAALREVSNFLEEHFRRMRHHHDRDIALGVSPRALKCTTFEGYEIEMGVCKISFIEDEDKI